MLQLGQIVHLAESGGVGLDIGTVDFLAGGSQALVRRSFGLAGPDVASAWIQIERLSPVRYAALQPYGEIPSRNLARNPLSVIDRVTIPGG